MHRIWVVMGLLFGLMFGMAVAGCGDSNVVITYCSLHDYCFAGTEYDECMDTREVLQEEALAGGAACHDAFVLFHQCVGELSCMMLDEYYEDGAYCSTEYAVYQNRCYRD